MTRVDLMYNEIIIAIEDEYEHKVEQVLMEHPTVPKRIAQLSCLRKMIKQEVEEAKKIGANICF